jgi:exosome complex component RRP40
MSATTTTFPPANRCKYIPAVGDLVIATIRNSSVDVYHAHLTDFTSAATLPQLSFEGANRKTRQQLTTGALVYARVSVANKHMDPELECVSQSTGKSNGLGPLIGGMLFTISLGMARRLMLPNPAEQGRVVVLDEFGAAGVSFEIAVGRNGKLWVDSASVKTTLAIGKAIQETDFNHLEPEEQKKLAAKLVKNI